MHETIQKMARAFAKERTQRRRAYAGFTALAILVSVTTTYMLVQPANTMAVERTYVCGMEEHVHTDACYEWICDGTDDAEDTDREAPGDDNAAVTQPEDGAAPEATPEEPETPAAEEPKAEAPAAQPEEPEAEESTPVTPAESEEAKAEETKAEAPAAQPEEPKAEEPAPETPAEPEASKSEEPASEESAAPAEGENLTASLIHNDPAPADVPASEESAAPAEPEAPKAEEPKAEEPAPETPAEPEEPKSEESAAPAEDGNVSENDADTPHEDTSSSGHSGHVHTSACRRGALICGKEEHVHTNACLESVVVLPEGTEIPDGYDNRFVAQGDGYTVAVYAPDGALPEGAELVVALLDEDSEGYADAAVTLTAAAAQETELYVDGAPSELAFAYDGFVALDIHFELDGEEIEPTAPVMVYLDVQGLLPEDADPDSVQVQHHATYFEAQPVTLDLEAEEDTEPAEPVELVALELVADGTEEIGALETSEGDDGLNVTTLFTVESFSKFTVTWTDIPGSSCIAYTGKELMDQFIRKADYADNDPDIGLKRHAVTISDALNADGTLRLTATGSDPYCSMWTSMESGGTRGAIAVQDYGYVLIGFRGNNVNFSSESMLIFGVKNTDVEYKYADYRTAVAYSNMGSATRDSNYHYAVLNLADVYNAKSESDAKLKAIRLDFINNNTDSAANQYIDIDIVAFCSGEDAAVELAENRAFDDRVVSTVEGNGITFQLFDYDQTINKEKDSDGHWQWRDISEYFTFRDARYSGETDGPDKDGIVRGNHQNKQHDKDGFFRQHTTVERKLVNDYPVLDLTRNADGTQRTDANSNVLGKDNLLSADKRSLAYLFGGADDFAVTSYPVSNTILQKNGDTYSYDSAKNAVDYDATERVFKVREYSERNEESAKYGNSIGDFLPFNHTGGVVVGARDETPGLNAPYNIAKKDVNYWFGMRMDVEFIQSRDGKLHGEDMIFEFSGDDDVWVFIDDVLVLDLGGTHGTVYGSINFATGEIKQYLNWQDGKEDNTVEAANEADEATSFPTTLKACLEAAGVNTNDVLTEDGVYKNWSQHKLSFFYMERGAAVANCKIDFNLPTVENGTLNVSKEVSGTTSAEYTDAMYKFQLMKGETPIQISGVTDANGIFEVKGGETQVFNVSALDTGTYTVRELIPVSQAGKFEAVKVNSYSVVAGEEVTYGEVTYKPYTSETFNISSESIDKSFTFTFDNEVKAGGLRITKLVNRTDGVDDTSGTFQFRITLPKALAGTYPVTYSSDLSAGTTNGEVVFTAVDDKAVGVITLCHGQTATITEIPAFSGTLTAEEINSDGYAVKWTHGDNTQWSTSASVTDGLAPGDTIALICTNTTGAQLPSTGGMGTNVFTGLGITMMLGAGVLLMTQRRRREASFRS